MNMTLALTSYLARHYDRAIEELQKIIEMEENFGAAHSVLGAVYEQKGMYEKSIAEHEMVLKILGDKADIPKASVKANIGHVYAVWGKRSEATKMLDELSKWRDVLPYSIASIYAVLGEKDQAFELLNRAYEQRSIQIVSLQADPSLDSLRSDPRFTEMVMRMGFPQRFHRRLATDFMSRFVNLFSPPLLHFNGYISPLTKKAARINFWTK